MSDLRQTREPVEVIEIIVPKCTNVYGSAPCTATGSGNSKCFNTRATCADPANFQARPLSHLTADLLVENLTAIASGDIDRTVSILVEAKVRFAGGAVGTIWEQGGSADQAAYLGITGTDLIFRAFDGTAASGTGVARLAVPVAQFEGRNVTLIGSINVSDGSVTLWEFDPVEYVLTLIGSNTRALGAATPWAGTDGGATGQDGGSNIATGEDGGTFNGDIETVAFFESTTGSVLDETEDAYRTRYFFDDGRKAIPAGGLYIMPLLLSATPVGTRINITGSDTRYEPIGRRAYMSVRFADAPHSDFLYDPYLSDRTYDPLKRSTFWSKWMIRNKFGKTRALVRRYTGYDGDSLADMQRTTYVLDAFEWSGESASIKCRDVISLTEFRRAQVPAPSPGKLAAAITDIQTTFALDGDQEEFYPASGGTVRINDELLTYTSRLYDGSTQTDFSTVTRATNGSTASDHDENDNVQLCRVYTAARIDDVLTDFFITDAKVPAQLVDLAKFKSEYDGSLSAYELTTVISEPTGIDELIGELAEQCAFYIWWNERRQIVDMQAIKPLSGVDYNLTQEEHIIADSFSLTERPKERVTTVSLYYNPRDFAGELNKPTNYKNQLVVSNSTAQGLDKYGLLPQTREVFSRWLISQAQINQTGSRYSLRYADVPNYAELAVDAKDRAIWAGDFVSLSHDYLTTADGTGARDTSRRWLVIEAEELVAGHSQKLTVVDVTQDGQIYVIGENGLTFSAELFGQGIAFITNADGTNIDGSQGATIG